MNSKATEASDDRTLFDQSTEEDLEFQPTTAQSYSFPAKNRPQLITHLSWEPPITRPQLEPLAEKKESTKEQRAPRVPDYLCLSIFTTFCCCLCIGVVAMGSASEANFLKHNNPVLAMKRARTARNLIIAGNVCGVTIFTILLVRLLTS